MEPDELRRIVEMWGGVERFAALISVRPRTVYYWLDGNRKIRPMVAKFIRSFAPLPSPSVPAPPCAPGRNGPSKENPACAETQNGVVSSLSR